jgi:regulator of sigma E protease
MAILIFIVILGLLVFVHELGHFTVARRNGIKADEFGFGFPPRLIGFVWDGEKKRHRLVAGKEEVASPYTVYSLNWIPLGGFVKIKGENGEQQDADSFAVKSAWVRIKVLAAGVLMNFLLAWVLLSVVFSIGFPKTVGPDDPVHGARQVQISQVLAGTPAEAMGLSAGDFILSLDGVEAKTVESVQRIIGAHAGEVITVRVRRGDRELVMRGTPRSETSDQPAFLGFRLGEVEMMRYPWYSAPWYGAVATYDLTLGMLEGIGDIVAGLWNGTREGLNDVSGPIGIAKLTGQVSALGFVYILYFSAILSINLGIVNILPIPALDGGRILFIFIELLKGSPVKQQTEAVFHQIGMLALLLLMVIVTVSDVSKLNFVARIFG